MKRFSRTLYQLNKRKHKEMSFKEMMNKWENVGKYIRITRPDQEAIWKKLVGKKKSFTQNTGHYPDPSVERSMKFISFCETLYRKLKTWMFKCKNPEKFRTLVTNIINCIDPSTLITVNNNMRKEAATNSQEVRNSCRHHCYLP